MKKIKMPKIFTEFKEFITRGNVMGLASSLSSTPFLSATFPDSSPCSCPRMRTVWNSSAISIPR